jgi:hypothetical protein
MLYFQVLFYIGSLLLLSYHYSQLIRDIYRTGLVLGSIWDIVNLTQHVETSCDTHYEEYLGVFKIYITLDTISQIIQASVWK